MESSYHQIKDIASKYSTDDIFIIGKGSSIDKVDSEIFEQGIVINLNDSEKIVRGDICLFYAPWVVNSLQESGFGCSLYITDQTIDSQSVKRLEVNRVDKRKGDAELIVQRFHSEQLSLENPLLVSAIKVARIISDFRRRRQNVYFVGFDFDATKGYSATIGKDYSQDDKNYQAQLISSHEHYFIMFCYILRESSLLIQHVGDKEYSDYSYAQFAALFNAQLKSQEQIPPPVLNNNVYEVNCDSKVKIVAELTTNFFGDLERMEQMIKLAKEAGADFVKVQKRDVESFYSKEQLDSHFESPFGSTFRDYRHALELDREGFEHLDKVCRKIGITWFVSILDLASFEFMKQFNPPMIKLPSTISQHTDFIQTVAREYKGDVVISTGYTDQQYEFFIVNTFANNERLYLMQCNSAYPTPPEHCDIAVVRHYHHLAQQYPNIVPGYSSHDFGSMASMLAVSAGAKILEKHVKLGNTAWAHFDSVAMDLTTDEFNNFVSDIRTAEKIVGAEQKRINDSEQHKYWLRSVATK